MAKVSQTCRRRGAKVKQVPWIKEIINQLDYRVYTEAFCGSSALFLSLDPVRTEILNDKDEEIYNLHSVLKDNKLSTELFNEINYTPYSKSEFERARDSRPPENKVQRARRFLMISIMSMRAGEKTFDTAINKDDFVGRVNYWYNYPNSIKSFNKRLRGTVIEKMDGLACLEKYDRETALHYIDPPYYDHADKYECAVDHDELIKVIKGLVGYVILSGYDNLAYFTHLEKQGWEKLTRKAYAQGGHKRQECIWLNPALVFRLGNHQPVPLFEDIGAQ